MRILSLLSKAVYGVFFFTIVCSCNKHNDIKDVQQEIAFARPSPTPPPVHGVCDYNLDENTLISAGWTKTFEDNFDADLSKWNIWYGGAFNNELQMYQASNLSLSSGNLVIAAKHETVTGPTTPFDATQKTFN